MGIVAVQCEAFLRALYSLLSCVVFDVSCLTFDALAEEERASCFVFRWIVTCVAVCLLFFLVHYM